MEFKSSQGMWVEARKRPWRKLRRDGDLEASMAASHSREAALLTDQISAVIEYTPIRVKIDTKLTNFMK